MTDPFQSPLVFDTSAVYCFGHRGRLERVLAEYSARYTLVIPPDAEQEVLSEAEYAYPDLLARHFQQKASAVDVLGLDWLAEVSRRLDPGEIGVLVVAYETNGTAIIDEKRARAEAKRLGIACVGTFRLLRHAVECGWISDVEARSGVARMQHAGFSCPSIDAFSLFSAYYAAKFGG